MSLATHFNLQSKTKRELHGLYAMLFNELADKNLPLRKKQQAQLALNMVKNILSSETITTPTLI